MDTITLIGVNLPTQHPKVSSFNFQRKVQIKRRDYAGFFAHVTNFMDTAIVDPLEEEQIKKLSVTKWTNKLKNKRKKPTLRSICEVPWRVSGIKEVKPRVFEIAFNKSA